MEDDVADAEVEVTLERQAANAAPAADPALSQWKDWMRASQKNQKVGFCRRADMLQEADLAFECRQLPRATPKRPSREAVLQQQ